MSNLVAQIGGVFIYSADPQKLAAWYETHLGLKPDFAIPDSNYGKGMAYVPEGATDGTDLPKSAFVWSIQKASAEMLAAGGPMRAVVNYRVHDMQQTIAHLATLGFDIKADHYPGQGYFAHMLDGDGNKIELWQDEFEY